MADEYIPTFHFVEISEDKVTAARQADTDNAQGPAVVEYTRIQTGIGQLRLEDAIEFPVSFRTVPHFTCGSGVVANPDEKLYQDPRGSSGVRSWVRDARGLFVGAKVWIRAEIARFDGASFTTYAARATKVEHFMTFSGIAVKNLPGVTFDPALTPRSTGLGG